MQPLLVCCILFPARGGRVLIEIYADQVLPTVNVGNFKALEVASSSLTCSRAIALLLAPNQLQFKFLGRQLISARQCKGQCTSLSNKVTSCLVYLSVFGWLLVGAMSTPMKVIDTATPLGCRRCTQTTC